MIFYDTVFSLAALISPRTLDLLRNETQPEAEQLFIYTHDQLTVYSRVIGTKLICLHI